MELYNRIYSETNNKEQINIINVINIRNCRKTKQFDLTTKTIKWDKIPSSQNVPYDYCSIR